MAKKKKDESLNIWGALHHMMGGTVADRAKAAERREEARLKLERRKFKSSVSIAEREFKRGGKVFKEAKRSRGVTEGLEERRVEVSEAAETRAQGSQAIQDRYMDSLTELNREQARIMGDADLQEAKRMLTANQALYTGAQYQELMQPINAKQKILNMRGPLTETQQAQQDAVIDELAGIRMVTKISDELGVANLKLNQMKLMLDTMAETRAQSEYQNSLNAARLGVILGSEGSLRDIFGDEATTEMRNREIQNVLGTRAEPIAPRGPRELFSPSTWLFGGEAKAGKKIQEKAGLGDVETSISPNTELERVLQNLQGLER